MPWSMALRIMWTRGRRLLDHVAIELGLLALHDKLHLFLLLRGEVADQPLHFVEGPADRHHAKDMALRCNSLVIRPSWRKQRARWRL